jgi:hypothetical protein
MLANSNPVNERVRTAKAHHRAQGSRKLVCEIIL